VAKVLHFSILQKE